MNRSRHSDATRVRKLRTSIAKARTVRAPENSLGQWIGYFLDRATHVVLSEVITDPSLEPSSGLALLPEEGGPKLTLPDDFGDDKQIDHAIYLNQSPLVIVESKWLKDKRHLNDKSAWIRQLKEVVEVNDVKQALLVLGGPWDRYRDRMERRGFGVVIIEVAYVYDALRTHGISIDIDRSREAYRHPDRTLNQLLDVLEELIADGNPDPLATIGGSMLEEQRVHLRAMALKALRLSKS